jgi:hypothetical protein
MRSIERYLLAWVMGAPPEANLMHVSGKGERTKARQGPVLPHTVSAL